jgi:HK97 family phage major capsid protein
MIEMLRNNMVMVSAGVRVLSGLVGNILIPKKTGASTAYWVAEGAAITESTPAVGQIGMTMKTVGAMADFSWDLLRQSSLDVQAFIQSDLSETLAIEADRAILDGSGVSGQPRGILNTSGIGAVNGGSLSWADIIEFQTDVRTANVRGEDFAWISRASVWGLTQTRPKETGYPLYLSDGQTMAGYPYFITEQMPASSLIYGQFSQILVGHWGVLELVSENITQLPNRIVRVVAFMAMDVAIRQPVAFSLADGDVT